jgi:mannose-P-dolichol utilization defect protein 1
MNFQFLLRIPLVPELATFIWGGDDDKLSPEICLSDVFESDCLVRLAVKAVGVAMITGAFLNKLPIILNIMSSKSTAGLARASVYAEIIVLTHSAVYGIRNSLPITSYGENGALLVQCFVITICIWQFTKIGFEEILGASLLYANYLYAILVIVPEHRVPLLLNSILPVMIYSKGSQIVTIFQESHTGNQSIITLSMNVIGPIMRVFTTIGEVGWDWNLLSTHLIGAALNVTLLLQYVYYQENTKRFWKEQEAKKKE